MARTARVTFHRVVLRRSRYLLYYTVTTGQTEIVILAIWPGPRGSRPLF